MPTWRDRTIRVTIATVLITLVAACSGDVDSDVQVDDPTAAPASTAAPDPTPVPTVVPTVTPEPIPTMIPPRVPAVGISVGTEPFVGPQSSSAVAVTPDGRLLVAVNPDSDSVTIVDAETSAVLAEVGVGDDPRTLAITPDGSHALVANHGDRTVSAVNLSAFQEVALWPVGAKPYGVVTDGLNAYVTEFGTGRLRSIQLSSGTTVGEIDAGPFPSGIALDLDGGKLLVTHLFDGDVTIVETRSFTSEMTISTGLDNNVSQVISVSPDGSRAYVPQTRANVSNLTLSFDSTVFPVVNVINLDEPALISKERITLDTADKPVSLPFDVAITPDSKRVFVLNAGSDAVSVIDLETNRGVAHLVVGANPRGIAISPDGGRAYVNNVLDGTLSVIDTAALTVIETVKVTNIPLAPDILLGKQIFNSAADPVLSTDGWIACSSCHFDGGADARTWLGFPDGPRNTPALFGVGETLPIHWSGDLDELEDAELTIRNIQAGTGLIDGNEFDSLGPKHAGKSVDLDALAAYMDSLVSLPTPHQTESANFVAGLSVFHAAGCAECHVPGTFVDGEIHDVGTGDPALEKNSHGRGTQFDTPSLRGLWLTAPYFHDGTAPTLQDVLKVGDVHSVADQLSDDAISDLVAYLLALPVGTDNLDSAILGGTIDYGCPGETNREGAAPPWC
ncbi:MAG: beta-propeller fold lactonase family protein [Chloroflexi bacterium]|nr:beta-propeller fold lactonase family protein [Chloroflexota bacterium]